MLLQTSIMYHSSREVLGNLASKGYDAISFKELVRSHGPFNEKLADCLAQYLPLIDEPAAADAVVFAIQDGGARCDISLLAHAYDNLGFTGLRADSVRWQIARTMQSMKAKKIAGWLEKTLLSDYSRMSREQLCLVVIQRGVFPSGRAQELLRSVVNDLPMHVAEALGKAGTCDDYELLSSIASLHAPYVRKVALKAIKKIEKRTGVVCGLSHEVGKPVLDLMPGQSVTDSSSILFSTVQWQRAKSVICSTFGVKCKPDIFGDVLALSIGSSVEREILIQLLGQTKVKFRVERPSQSSICLGFQGEQQVVSALSELLPKYLD